MQMKCLEQNWGSFALHKSGEKTLNDIFLKPKQEKHKNM
jgi:hypothetical protein